MILVTGIEDNPDGGCSMTDEKKQYPSDDDFDLQPERLGYRVVEPFPEPPRGAPIKASQQKGTEVEKTEEKPEPLRYAIIEPAPVPPLSVPQNAGQQKGIKSRKIEKKPEPPLSAPIKAGLQQDVMGGKSEEKPEPPPRYAIVDQSPVSPGIAAAAPVPKDAVGEKTVAQPEPLRYAIIEPPPPPPPDRFLQSAISYSAGAVPDPKVKTPTREPAVARPSTGGAPAEKSGKPAKRPGRFYIWLTVGLGVLFGCVLAVVFSRTGAPDVPHDWGSATSDAAGLKGHLYTKWDDRLEYLLRLQPGDSDRHAGFALAVAHPPRPLSIEIHLVDTHGFVLCSREIVLKYNAPGSPEAAAPNPGAQAATAGAANDAGSEKAQALEKLAAAQEAERELGKDVFQNEIGPDGKVGSIAAQGEFPCSDKAYASAYSWSITSNFPTVAEQDELIKHQPDALANGDHSSAETAAARRKAPRIPSPPLLSFTIEGDDAIVDFDISRGVMETRSEKTFLFDKASGEIGNPKWQEYPVSIHYICDQASRCTITHSGAGALHARMSR